MATRTIRQLPSAATPLSGAELLELVQASGGQFVSVKGRVRNIDHNTLANKQGGVPSAGEFFHVSQDIFNGLFSGSPLIGLGNKTGTRLDVDYGNNTIEANMDTYRGLRIEEGSFNDFFMIVGNLSGYSVANDGVGIQMGYDWSAEDSFMYLHVFDEPFMQVDWNTGSGAGNVILGLQTTKMELNPETRDIQLNPEGNNRLFMNDNIFMIGDTQGITDPPAVTGSYMRLERGRDGVTNFDQFNVNLDSVGMLQMISYNPLAEITLLNSDQQGNLFIYGSAASPSNTLAFESGGFGSSFRVLSIGADEQLIGKNSNNLSVNQQSKRIKGIVDNSQILTLEKNTQVLGVSGASDTNLTLDQQTNTITNNIGGLTLLNLTSASQIFGSDAVINQTYFEVDLNNQQLKAEADSYQCLLLEGLDNVFGLQGGVNIRLNGSSIANINDFIDMSAGTSDRVLFMDGKQTQIGREGPQGNVARTNLSIFTSAAGLGPAITADVEKVEVLDLTNTSQRIGPTDDASITIDQPSGVITAQAATTEIFRLQNTLQRLGGDASTNIEVDQDPGEVRVKVDGNADALSVSAGQVSGQVFVTIEDVLRIKERTSDPQEPLEGTAIIWLSDGTQKGNDGDVMIASKVNGQTRFSTLFVHASGATW